MKPYLLTFLLFITPLFANAKPLEFAYIAGQRNIKPIIFSEINKENIEAEAKLQLSGGHCLI